jgi:hypothetical protein
MHACEFIEMRCHLGDVREVDGLKLGQTLSARKD